MDNALSDGQIHMVQATVSLSASLSVIATVFVIISYWYFDEARVFHLRLILNLAITDCVSSFIMVFGVIARNATIEDQDVDNNPYYSICVIVGAFMQYFLLAGVLWTFCIAITLYLVLYKNDYNPERFEKYYHMFCWIVPAIFDFILLISGSLGDSGVWCWIEDDRSNLIFRSLSLYAPLLAVIFTSCYLYAITYWRLHKQRRNYTPTTQDEEEHEYDPYRIQNSFGYFLAILIICWFFPILNNILDNFYPTNVLFCAYLISGASLPLQGFLNSLVYGLNDGVRTKLMKSPIFRTIGNCFVGIRNLIACIICPLDVCKCCKRKKKKTQNSQVVNATAEEKKQWYNACMTEYDDIPDPYPSTASLHSNLAFSHLGGMDE